MGRMVVMLLLVGALGCSSPSSQVELNAMKQEMDSLQSRVRLLELKRIADAPLTRAELDLGSGRLDMLESSYGPLAVRVADIQPFAAGSRVTIEVGNLTAAIIGAGTFDVEYGPHRGKEEALQDWRQQLRHVEAKFTDGLQPGMWNPITVTLDQIDPDSLGHVTVSVGELPSISLGRAR